MNRAAAAGRAALVAAALLLTGGAGAPAPDGYRMDEYRAQVPDTVPGGQVAADPAAVRALAASGAVLVDVLPALRRPEGMRPGSPWLPQPHRTIPGSLWLPEVGRGAISGAADAWFRARLAQATGGDLDRPVLFFCQRDCWMSWNAAKRAATYGYQQVWWYPDGTDGWTGAGLPLAEARAEPPPDE